ncbi:non-specific serine,threonine protein kinase [Sarracenia purpurea var. burkii]
MSLVIQVPTVIFVSPSEEESEIVDIIIRGEVKQLQNPETVFETIISLVVRLAEHGLIHCDFNEFNIMINDNEEVTMIDFPQMVSVSHRNAQMYEVFLHDASSIFHIIHPILVSNFIGKIYASVFDHLYDIVCAFSGILTVMLNASTSFSARGLLIFLRLLKFDLLCTTSKLSHNVAEIKLGDKVSKVVQLLIVDHS